MLITQEQIWQKLNELDQKLEKFWKGAEQFSVEEISLNKACRLLRLGDSTIIKLVKSGKLKARIYRDSNHRQRYRFLLKDIKEFQDSTKYQHEFLQENCRTAEEIAREIFQNNKRKVS